MLKFIKHHLDTIDGIGIYPVLSFVIFFSFFIVVLLWLRTTSRTHMDHLTNLPFDVQEPEPETHHAH